MGFTNLDEGLSLTIGELANPGDGHDRPEPGSPDYVVVITDGNPNRPIPEATARANATARAATLAGGGAEVYVVGVGADVDTTYLQNDIASSPSNYFGVGAYGGLETALNQISTACE